MSDYTFAPAEHGDPEATAKYQIGLAKLKPACMRCGRTLAKGEVAACVCRDREVCRICRSGGSTAGFVALRRFAQERAAKREEAIAA